MVFGIKLTTQNLRSYIRNHKTHISPTFRSIFCIFFRFRMDMDHCVQLLKYRAGKFQFGVQHIQQAFLLPVCCGWPGCIICCGIGPPAICPNCSIFLMDKFLRQTGKQFFKCFQAGSGTEHIIEYFLVSYQPSCRKTYQKIHVYILQEDLSGHRISK